MSDKLKVPKFSTEAEEAQWWFDNRGKLTKAFRLAAARGEMGRGSVAKLERAKSLPTSPTESVRLDAGDV